MQVEKESSRGRFERLKAEVLNLTPKQKQVLITLLADVEKEPKEVTYGFASVLLGAVNDHLVQKQGASARVPYPVMAPKLGKSLPDAARAVQTFLADHIECTRAVKEVERVGCVLYLVNLADRYLNTVQIPVTHRTLVQQLVRVGVVFNDAFPGYLQSGLAPMVFEARGCLLKH